VRPEIDALSDEPEGAAARYRKLLLAAYADVIHSLVPEAASISIHDATGETLSLTSDFLSPDEHALVAQLLQSPGDHDSGGDDPLYAEADLGALRAGLRVRTLDGRLAGAVLIGLDLQSSAAIGPEPLERRLASVLTCLAEALDPSGRHASRREQEVTDGPVTPVRQPALMASEIRQALENERFELFLQPIRSLQGDLDLPRFEVLLRLRDRRGQLLGPSDFLPVAEQHQLMPAIDRWVVRSLLSWLMHNRRRWRVPSTFAVNLSADSLDDPNFLDYLERCIDKSSVPPEALCFEFNTAAAARRSERFAEAGRSLARIGCQVALDDFGAEPRGSEQLRHLPAHCVKIDHALVAAAQTDEAAQTTISGIVRAAADLGMTTIVEAVESDEELTLSRALGIEFAQGFLLGKPEALESFDFAAAR
jgi:EAL domain-containing protein (putative c-di-GMP-specific phosphodiesterase class I)